VCGTPGSLVHFFPTLRRIVHGTLHNQIRKATAPSGEAYREVEKKIVHDIISQQRRRDLVNKRMVRKRRSTLEMDKREVENVKGRLKTILSQAGSLLEKECGEECERCSWEKEMKAYILTFP
jgi:hypothetical protein